MRRRHFLALGAHRSRRRGASAAGRAWAQAVTRTKLPNGFTLLVRENPDRAGGRPVPHGARWARAGRRATTRGSPTSLQLMVVRGTEKLDGSQIVAAADRMGGSIDAYGDVDCLRDRRHRAVAPLDRDARPRRRRGAHARPCPSATTEAVRDFLLNQLRNRGDKPYDVASTPCSAQLYGDHPYALEPSGRRDSVERIDRGTP